MVWVLARIFVSQSVRGYAAGLHTRPSVLQVEDIIDTGFTLSHVTALLRSRKPARLECCALLDKPSRREIAMQATWTGFTIPDEFVVGYGIDFAQRNRNLPYIGKVRFLDDAPPPPAPPELPGKDLLTSEG